MTDSFNCPRCGHGLENDRSGTVDVLVCPSESGCGGLWCSQAAFDALDTATREAASQRAEAKLRPMQPFPGIADGTPLACPDCAKTMEQRHFRYEAWPTPVVLDHCDEHGIWFDAEELDAVLRIIENHVVRKTDMSQPRRAALEQDKADSRARHKRWLKRRKVEDSAAGDDLAFYGIMCGLFGFF